MRNILWKLVRQKVPEGQILPWWAITARSVLYPLDFFYWRMSEETGYQWKNDTWLINGVTYSGEAMRWLAKAQGETYRVTRTGKTITLERVTSDQSQLDNAYRCGFIDGQIDMRDRPNAQVQAGPAGVMAGIAPGTES